MADVSADRLAGSAPGDAMVPTFEATYQAEYASMVGLGYVLTGDRNVAEELVQDTFAEAHRRWSTVSSYEKPGAWLRRVLVNKVTSRRRRLGSETKALARLRLRRPPDTTIPETSNHVWAAVRRLPARQAQAIALHYLEDLTIAQIAEVLDCGEETVKTHLKRGRSRLARELGSAAPVEES